MLTPTLYSDSFLGHTFTTLHSLSHSHNYYLISLLLKAGQWLHFFYLSLMFPSLLKLTHFIHSYTNQIIKSSIYMRDKTCVTCLNLWCCISYLLLPFSLFQHIIFVNYLEISHYGSRSYSLPISPMSYSHPWNLPLLPPTKKR